jgi:hypothetical protein
MTSTHETEAELETLLLDYGLRIPTIRLYIFLLTHGASTYQKLLRSRIVDFKDVEPSLFILSNLFLVSKQQLRDKERYYAVDPQIAWKWQEFKKVWDVLRRIVPKDTPPMFTNATDERRVALIKEIRKKSSNYFEKKPLSCVRGGRGRPQFDEGDYAHVCAEAISLASRRFLAVDRPPNDTRTLPIFWSAITERRENGVIYDRIVSVEEAFHHGLDIVKRDVKDIGIDIQFADHQLFTNTYYIVDDYCAIMRDDGSDDRIFSRITYDKGKILRLHKHASKLQSQSAHARELIAPLKAYAASYIANLSNLTREQRDMLETIASMGKFANLNGASEDALSILVQREIIVPLDEGFSLNIEMHRGYGLAWLASP